MSRVYFVEVHIESEQEAGVSWHTSKRAALAELRKWDGDDGIQLPAEAGMIELPHGVSAQKMVPWLNARASCGTTWGETIPTP